ncbi:HDOD domain-containing protein [Massilia sp. W12]|uniref:HDOD domain-containing protein n=1 Tax=Massilia sp. W12 TaxID=3126507 RepID=UPI0030CFB72A
MPAIMTEERKPDSAATRERLLLKFSKDVDLLSLGVAIARVVELASSEDEATHSLTYYVLSDTALTQKILKLANTVFYRSAASSPVTTVSRAIFLLGFDTVKSTALALLLVDNLANRRHADMVRKELLQSLCASLIGRELTRMNPQYGGEEASIAALFRNLGQLLVASYENPLYRQVLEKIEDGLAPGLAMHQTLGCTYEFLTEQVLHGWNMPDSLADAMHALPAGPLRPAKSRQEWLRQAVSFAQEVAPLILSREALSSAQLQALLARYGQALHLDLDRMKTLFGLVGREIAQVSKSLNLDSAPRETAPPPAAPAGPSLPGVLKLAAMDNHVIQTDERYPSGKPLAARDMLLAGIQVATQMLARANYKPSELMTLVVETLYSSLGFRFAAICVKDSRLHCYRAVLTMGEQHVARQQRFCFPFDSACDVFHLAMENSADLMISDACTPKIRELLPDWHKQLLPDARSMMVLPIVVEKMQFGLFYGDRRDTAPEGISSDEAALIKTLMGQLVTAMSTR